MGGRGERSGRLRGAARVAAVASLLVATAALSACGLPGAKADSDESSDKTVKAAALSLQQAMDSSARAIDGVRGTRESLDRLGSSLQSSVDQTNDVINVLMPRAADSPGEQGLLQAARDQRSFLQEASSAAGSRSRASALSALSRARETGQKATVSYTTTAQSETTLAGLLPASTTFNTGRLRDAVSTANAAPKKKKKTTTKKSSGGGGTGGSNSGGGGTPAPAPSGGSCGGGISVNSATSCAFAQNVASAYAENGGDPILDVYSPKTGQTYRMTCSGGYPNVCTGGNNAQVTIR